MPNREELSYLFDCTGPTVIGFVGPNGSGKSSIVEAAGFEGVSPGSPLFKGRMAIDPQTGGIALPIINPDDIARGIAAANPDLTVDECNARAFTEANEIRQLYARAGIDFAFETVGSHPSKVEFLEEMRTRGYTTAVLFVSTKDPAINLRRVALRVSYGGHDVPPEKVVERYERTMKLLPRYFIAADYMSIYDNSVDSVRGCGGGAVLLLTKQLDRVKLTAAGKASPWLKERMNGLI